MGITVEQPHMMAVPRAHHNEFRWFRCLSLTRKHATRGQHENCVIHILYGARAELLLTADWKQPTTLATEYTVRGGIQRILVQVLRWHTAAGP